MKRPFTYDRDDMDLGFQNILYILGPYVVCTFSTEHHYFTIKPVLFFLFSTMEPNMFVVNVTAFIVSEYFYKYFY